MQAVDEVHLGGRIVLQLLERPDTVGDTGRYFVAQTQVGNIQLPGLLYRFLTEQEGQFILCAFIFFPGLDKVIVRAHSGKV